MFKLYEFSPNSQLFVVKNEAVECYDGQDGVACVLSHHGFTFWVR